MKLRRPALVLLTLVLAAVAGLAACEPATPGAAAGQRAVTAARGELGQPYKYGSVSRATGGYDCSGLTSFAWKKAGATGMPRSSSAQYSWTQRISRADLRPGDLVFYGSGGVSHVALYEGMGKVVHARKTGLPVREDSIDFWPGHLIGYGRVPASALPT